MCWEARLMVSITMRVGGDATPRLWGWGGPRDSCPRSIRKDSSTPGRSLSVKVPHQRFRLGLNLPVLLRGVRLCPGGLVRGSPPLSLAFRLLPPCQDLKKYGATTVVRVCEVTYDKAPLEKDGITVVVRAAWCWVGWGRGLPQPGQ